MEKKNDCWLDVKNVTISRGKKNILNDISFSLCAGESLAITGPSGSGKTQLVLAILQQVFYKGDIIIAPQLLQKIAWVEQQHHFKNLSNTSDLYYQQRFNSFDAEDAKTVREVLAAPVEELMGILKEMGIDNLVDKPLIQLSNGENKKVQLANSLLSLPAVLILDQPFTGLDSDTRKYLHALINKLIAKKILVLLISDAGEIPESISKVLVLENGMIKSFGLRNDFIKKQSGISKINNHLLAKGEIDKVLIKGQHLEFEYAVRMKNVQAQYGDKKILDNINWQVKQGERWLLSGPNGAGKSTLLSLITADNPRAYANDIYLFDKKRGTGESIWDIKKQIGFLSPELHVYFDKDSTCFETVASGLFDAIGLFRQLSDDQVQLVRNWIEITGLGMVQQKRLYELSVGEQRKVLLIRALIKDPPLLILDEPCQGLDSETQSSLLGLIDHVCISGNKTMIFVTHYPEGSPDCIDHFIKLKDGMVKETGPVT
jgi:molybdate transport system ATP-binding protein